ncbi:MAG: hypothetical protein HYY16_03845, partial [Planctomycetes bacterium]|nr:hypothetical protein [Planctomycetota bacterium]
MMHRHRLLVPAMLVWLGSSATAQEPPGTILSQNFDQGLGTWVVTNPTGGVGWNADSSPGNVAGTGAHVSPPNSLNYNNGTSYSSNNAANQGTAKSPAVSLTGTTNPVLTFQCNYATELNADFDRRTLWIVQGATVVEGHQLIPPPAPG